MSEKLSLRLGMSADDSLLSLLLYEGILRLLRSSPAKYNNRELIFERKDVVQNAFRQFKKDIDTKWDEFLDNLNYLNTDVNSWSSIAKYLKHIGVDCNSFLDDYWSYCNSRFKKDKCKTNVSKIRFHCGLGKIKTDNKLVVPLGLIFKHTYRAFISKKSPEIIGIIDLTPEYSDGKINIDKKAISDDNYISIGLLKIDRYTGLNLMEYNRIDKQTTLRISWRAFTIYLLGIAGSYVRSYKNEHLLLFYKPEFLSTLILGSANNIEPDRIGKFVLSKNLASESLAYIYSCTDIPEILSLGLYVLPKLRDLLSSEENLIDLAFSIAIIKFENMYKRYSGWTVELSRHDPLDKIAYLIGSTATAKASFKKTVADSVTCPKSPLLHAISGRTLDYPDSHKALSSLIQLYRFYMTGSPSYFYDYVRNMYEAMEKCESSEDARGCRWRAMQYRKLLQCMGWVGSGECDRELQLCDH